MFIMVHSLNKELMEEFKQGIQYSEEVINAVRYGYQYRMEAERNDAQHLHYYLPTSEIALYLGKLVLDGLLWDVIKATAKYLYSKLLKSNTKFDELSSKLLTDEVELEKFYTCLKEYQDQSMAINQEQFEYIREEICADYFAKESSKIIESEGRLPNHEEILSIHRQATLYADEILKKRMDNLD